MGTASLSRLHSADRRSICLYCSDSESRKARVENHSVGSRPGAQVAPRSGGRDDTTVTASTLAYGTARRSLAVERRSAQTTGLQGPEGVEKRAARASAEQLAPDELAS